MSKVVVQVVVDDISGLGEYYPGYELTLEADDVNDWSSVQWFRFFEKVLSAQGFDEYVICAGAVELTFNDSRNQKTMKKIYDHYDLKEFNSSEEVFE